MKVFVLGGGGQVASAVVACAPARHAVTVKSQEELDITDERALTAAVVGSGADWLVNCAAYTAVDLAESEPERERECERQSGP